eukprot:510053-Pleurochrysis_carterae.AAC.2
MRFAKLFPAIAASMVTTIGSMRHADAIVRNELAGDERICSGNTIYFASIPYLNMPILYSRSWISPDVSRIWIQNHY